MSSNFEYFLGLAILIAAPLALVFYGLLLTRLRREGGRVRTDWVSHPDIPMILVLGGALAGLAINGIVHAGNKAAELKPDQIIPGMVFLLVLAGGVAGFLVVRRLPITRLTGIRDLSPPRAISRGVLLLLAALPVVAMFSIAMVLFMRESAQEQDLVKLFSDVSQRGDIATMVKIVVASVVIAPFCEEFLFRGYFYPVAKRFCGPAFGSLIIAALFAASHVNLASLPGLFVLALCFTIAYESTGSLLVPITMHACFNSANLLLLYLSAHARA